MKITVILSLIGTVLCADDPEPATPAADVPDDTW